MALSLGALIAQLRMDSSDFLKELGKAQRAITNFLQISSELSDHIIDIGKDTLSMGFESASAIQGMTVAFETLAGSAEEGAKMIEKIKKFALETPFDFEEVGLLAQSLAAFGVELHNVIPLMTIFGDQAALLNRGVPGIQKLVKAFTDMRSLGKAMTAEMNQFVNAGVPAWQILAETLGVSVAQAREKVKNEFVASGPVLAAIIERMAKQSEGAMLKSTQLMKGAWTAFVEDVKLKTGEAFIPWANAIADLIPQLAKVSESLGRFLEPALKGMIKLTVATEGALVVFNALPESFKYVVFGGIALSGVLVLLITGMTGLFFVISAIASTLVSIGTIIAAMGLPLFISLTAGVMGLVGSMFMLGGVLGLVALAFYNDWGRLRTHVLNIFKNLIKGITNLVLALDEFSTEAYLKLYDVSAAFNRMAVNVAKSMKAATEAVWGEGLATQGLQLVIDQLEEAYRLGEAFMVDVRAHGTFGNLAVAKLEDLAEGIGKLLAKTGDSIADGVKDFINGPLKETFMKLLPEEAQKALEQWLAGAEPPGAKALRDWLEQLLEDIRKIGAGDIPGGGKGKQGKDKVPDDWWVNVRREAAAHLKFHNLMTKMSADAEDLTKSVELITESFDKLFKKTFQRSILGPEGTIGSKIFGEGTKVGGLISAGASGASNAIFSGLTGLVGAIVNIVAQLITDTEAFAYLIERIDGTIGVVVTQLNRLLTPLTWFINVVFDMAEVILKLVFWLNPVTAAMHILGTIVGRLGAVLVPVLHVLQSLWQTFNTAGKAFNFVWRMLDGAMWVLFQVFKYLAVVINSFLIGVGFVWDLFLKAAIEILEVVKLIPGLSKPMRKAIKDLEKGLVVEGLTDSLKDLLDLTWEEAKAESEHIRNLEDTNKALRTMTEELINVPEGFKLALIRYTAADPGRGTFADTSGGRGNNRSKTAGAPPWSTARGSGAGGVSIYIENFYSTSEDLDDLIREIHERTDRQAFVSTGAPKASLAGRFST